MVDEIMEDKQKSIVSEPVAGTVQRDIDAGYDLDTDLDFKGKDFGYARTLDELELALDEADSERSDPSKWVTPVEFHSRIENKYPWLR